MKKVAFLFSLGFIFISCQTFSQTDAEIKKQESAVSTSAGSYGIATEADIQKQDKVNESMENSAFYKITVKDINGNDFSFKKLAGKKVIIVNTASNCGYTPQYAELETLYQKYKNSNLVILGFPSNDFGNQEPGKNEEIATFCSKNYGVTFPMMSKVSVKGDTMCELYQFLTQKNKNGLKDSTVEWNFQKYLINELGQLELIYPSKESPLSTETLMWVTKK